MPHLSMYSEWDWALGRTVPQDLLCDSTTLLSIKPLPSSHPLSLQGPSLARSSPFLKSPLGPCLLSGRWMGSLVLTMKSSPLADVLPNTPPAQAPTIWVLEQKAGDISALGT